MKVLHRPGSLVPAYGIVDVLQMCHYEIRKILFWKSYKHVPGVDYTICMCFLGETGKISV